MGNTLGDQELELLKFIEQHEPISVREMADQYGAEVGLARTTILTMMERLRKKSFLQRSRRGAVYMYRTVQENEVVLKQLVGDFIKRTLGGNLSPFVAYLSDKSELSDDEVRLLRDLLDRMEEK